MSSANRKWRQLRQLHLSRPVRTRWSFLHQPQMEVGTCWLKAASLVGEAVKAVFKVAVAGAREAKEL